MEFKSLPAPLLGSTEDVKQDRVSIKTGGSTFLRKKIKLSTSSNEPLLTTSQIKKEPEDKDGVDCFDNPVIPPCVIVKKEPVDKDDLDGSNVNVSEESFGSEIDSSWQPFESVDIPSYCSLLEPKVEMECPDDEFIPTHDTCYFSTTLNERKLPEKLKCEGCDKLILKNRMKYHNDTFWGLRESSCAVTAALSKTKENKNPIKRTRSPPITDKPKHYKCRECKKIFDDTSSLLQHTVKVHLKNVLFSCHQCDIKFGQLEQLKKHQVKVHGWGSPGKKTNNILNVNKKSKKQKSLTECKYCKEEFISKFCLSLHMTKYHSKCKLKCEHCEFTCKSKQKLTSHILDLHNDPFSYDLGFFFE